MSFFIFKRVDSRFLPFRVPKKATASDIPSCNFRTADNECLITSDGDVFNAGV